VLKQHNSPVDSQNLVYVAQQPTFSARLSLFNLCHFHFIVMLIEKAFKTFQNTNDKISSPPSYPLFSPSYKKFSVPY